MSRSLTYIFPASNTTDICNTQSLAAAGNLILNGNLANQINSAVSFIDHGYIRSIVISSATTANFTIKGTQNGVDISENLAVIANTPNQSNNCFDTITSISVDRAVNNVTIGSGYFGFFKLIGINLERDVINYSLSIYKLSAISISIAISGILSNIVNSGKTFLDIGANDNNSFIIKTDGAVDQYIFPNQNTGIADQPLYRYLLIVINGDQTTAANSLQLDFIQT